MDIFRTLFKAIWAKKMSLRYSKRKKRLLRLKRKKDQKEKINDLFPKGLTHAFGKKGKFLMGFF